jgi:hypothetical protein
VSWAKTPNRSERTAAARAALDAKWERDVDPDGVMDPDQRRLAAESARKAHYQRVTRLASAARWGKKPAA